MSERTSPAQKKKKMEYCNGCLRMIGGTCGALKVPFPLWSEQERSKANNECWSRQTSKASYIKEVTAMRDYFILKNGPTSESVKLLTLKIKKLEVRLAEERQSEMYEGLSEVYEEDIHRGEKGGGGEKADRTNKTFGKQQLKDNRFSHRKNNPKKYRDW